jgi:hypothetical protein
MMKRRNELGFTHEVRNKIRIVLKICVKELYCNETSQLRIPSFPYFAHATLSQPL